MIIETNIASNVHLVSFAIAQSMSYSSDFKPRPNIAQEMSKQYMKDFRDREEKHLAVNQREGVSIPHPEYMDYMRHCDETQTYMPYSEFKVFADKRDKSRPADKKEGEVKK